MTKAKRERIEIQYQKCAREKCRVEFPITRAGRSFCSKRCKAYDWKEKNPERFQEIAQTFADKKKQKKAEASSTGGGEHVREDIREDLR